MDSKTDSSVLSPLTILDSVKSELSKKRSARTTWAHTRVARDGERAYDGKALIKYCIYCTEPSVTTPTYQVIAASGKEVVQG
jgi:hypothetical protein